MRPGWVLVVFDVFSHNCPHNLFYTFGENECGLPARELPLPDFATILQKKEKNTSDNLVTHFSYCF